MQMSGNHVWGDLLCYNDLICIFKKTLSGTPEVLLVQRNERIPCQLQRSVMGPSNTALIGKSMPKLQQPPQIPKPEWSTVLHRLHAQLGSIWQRGTECPRLCKTSNDTPQAEHITEYKWGNVSHKEKQLLWGRWMLLRSQCSQGNSFWASFTSHTMVPFASPNLQYLRCSSCF